MIMLDVHVQHNDGEVVHVGTGPIREERALTIFSLVFDKIHKPTPGKPHYDLREGGYVYLVEQDRIAIGRQHFVSETIYPIVNGLREANMGAYYSGRLKLYTFSRTGEPRDHGYPDNVFNLMRTRASTIRRRYDMSTMSDGYKALIYGDTA